MPGGIEHWRSASRENFLLDSGEICDIFLSYFQSYYASDLISVIGTKS